MLFNSWHFIVFFITVTAAYFSLALKGRQWLLLLASCYFYMVFKPVYILILFATIVIDYFAGIYIEESEGKKRKYFLILSLISNIGILAFFKYHNFFNENLSRFTYLLGYNNPIPFLEMILPIGLSFHTFQAMSYTIEVYRKNFKAERNFMVYSLYVMFYPQLVAGPIERPQNVLPQLNTFHAFSWNNLRLGLLYMSWGLFKKVVIADRLALFVDEVYNIPSIMNTQALLLGMVFYSFQIYCDFSGYSHIALGAAKVMGYDLMKNFNQPYLSKSITEFWRRWHISLSTWFRDYLYISMGGNKNGFVKQAGALLMVFVLSGLWHGASWAFIFWGLTHGILVVGTSYWQKSNSKVTKEQVTFGKKSLQVIVTFVLVSVIWIPFRAGTLSNTIQYFKAFFNFQGIFFPKAFNAWELSFAFALIALLLLLEYFKPSLIRNKPTCTWCVVLLLLASSYFLGVFNEQQFIYFQF
jgi:alginate O-acetyltransferase complex protein AlgI